MGDPIGRIVSIDGAIAFQCPRCKLTSDDATDDEFRALWTVEYAAPIDIVGGTITLRFDLAKSLSDGPTRIVCGACLELFGLSNGDWSRVEERR